MAPNDKCSYSIVEKAQHAYMTKRRSCEEAEEEEGKEVVSWFRHVTLHEAWTSKHRQSFMSPDRLWRFDLDGFLGFGFWPVCFDRMAAKVHKCRTCGNCG